MAANDDAAAKAAGEALLKNPQFVEMFQRAMGDEKMPAEGDPKRQEWLKTLQSRLNEEAQREAQKELEKPVRDEEGEWMWIKPEPGFCIKANTTQRNKKVFINICKHPRIAEPQPLTEAEADPDMADAIKYRIPLSCGAARPDVDKKGSPCVVYDVIVNPNTIERCSQENEFRRFVAALCLNWIQQKSEPNLDADQFTNINVKCKGQPAIQRIRLAHPADASKSANALRDEIKLPENKGAAVAPSQAGTSTNKPMVMEVQPETPKPSVTFKHDGLYDWSAHKAPTRNAFFREVVPKTLEASVFLPGISTIKELEVTMNGRSVRFDAVDAEDGEDPFFEFLVPFPVKEEPENVKFVRSTNTMTMRFVVDLPDETIEEKRRLDAHAADVQKETAEEKQKREAAEKAHAERRERLERIEREEKQVMEQRKAMVENINAMQQGRLPPSLEKEIDAMPGEQARSMMMRIENNVRRGDAVDEMLDKLAPDVLANVVAHIRRRLGLAEPDHVVEARRKALEEQRAKQAAKAAEASESTTNQEFNFAKKAESLFGVKLENRFVFALEH